MRDGKWLMPRHPSRDVFEKDFRKIDLNPLEVYCPGCRSVVRIGRSMPNGKVGGWCSRCDRGVAP
ncbi:MAG: hypothetical protein ABII00_07565 [Elusimicrobiota bacterium]